MNEAFKSQNLKSVILIITVLITDVKKNTTVAKSVSAL